LLREKREAGGGKPINGKSDGMGVKNLVKCTGTNGIKTAEMRKSQGRETKRGRNGYKRSQKILES